MLKFIALATLVATTGSALAASSQRVAFSSLGKARVGMTEQAIARALGAPLTHVDLDAEEEGCYYASGRGLPKGASLMMLNNRLARVDVFEPGIFTVSGAGVGTSESELKRIYGSKLAQEPHAYTGPEGHYLTLRSADGRYGVRFETDGRLVTGFYAGTAEAIQYIEGCQ